MMGHVLLLSSLLLTAAGAGGEVLFEETFDGELQPAWKWIRPDVDEWRIQDNQLQVRSQFGRIWGGNDAKNVLVIQPSKADNIEARVNVAHAPKEKWEQAGLLWYVDDDNFVKLISEQIDGKMYAVICREQDGRGRVFGKVEAASADMQLRLVVQGNLVTGQWRIKETDPWSDSGSCQFDAAGDRYFGLFTQNGPKDQVRWVRFDSFVITHFPFVGNWALTIPGGGAGWLGIEDNDGKLQGSILWGGGSVVPVSSVHVDGDTLVVTRVHQGRRRGASEPNRETETIKACLDGDIMSLSTQRENADGRVRGKASFAGKRIPALPPAPDLEAVKYGEAISLFNGKDLSGWQAMNASVPNGWSVREGILVNDAPQEPGKHISYTNLRTQAEFEDFNLALEVRVPQGGNSGVYLRGIYEVQVADTFGRGLDSHNMGGIYSRITPTVSGEKPAGQWQTLDITLVDRHVTVVLNGENIIDNQPLLGCTGGALWSDEFRPGPLYLQGDHTSVDYRNIVLRPVVDN